ncbi:DUF6789 family protein [Nonomuraea sp. NPDC050663]|uniref:DUF6789 family protein n=1 Tax=Nonomuraea sp. NPDC050663 TaxID=3364370 RepID=UPI0017F3A4A8|nr:hypothetical protein [Thermoactinospora sp.]
MIRNLLRGAAAGSMATTAMSTVMLAGDKLGLMGEQPPRRVARRLFGRQGETPVAIASHFGFGAAGGALLSTLSRGRGVPTWLGAGYGMAIWLASYQGWVPAIGAMPPAHRDRPGRQAVMIAAHLVYGATLARSLRSAGRSTS